MVKRVASVALSTVVALATQIQPAVCSEFLGNNDERSGPNNQAGVNGRDVPQPIYSLDVEDAWNRVFYLLFTRRVPFRASKLLPDAGPFQLVYRRSDKLAVSERLLERIESGDRAIEPFHPFGPPGAKLEGVMRALTEPRFSQLELALQEALAEQKARTPLQRALLQTDIWAAYDMLHKHSTSNRTHDDKSECDRIMSLCAKLITKLALSPTDAQNLPANLDVAAQSEVLPDLLAANSDWIEVEWFPHRTHDAVADFRRVTRVFLKPASPTNDKHVFVDQLRPRSEPKSKLAAAALVTQLLVLNTNGDIMPTTLTYEVQVRAFEEGKTTQVTVGELSRRLLLDNPRSAGFRVFHNNSAAYLPDAGNDYFFASHIHLSRRRRGDFLPDRAAVLVSLQQRCAACHGDNSLQLSTFASRQDGANPPVEILDSAEHEHAVYVIRQKTTRQDFRELRAVWGT